MPKYSTFQRHRPRRSERLYFGSLGNLEQITSGSGPPRSVLARVVVGFQCLITHRALGEFFVPAEQIGIGDAGDGRADERCQPEHP